MAKNFVPILCFFVVVSCQHLVKKKEKEEETSSKPLVNYLENQLLSPAPAEQVGMSTRRLAYIDTFLLKRLQKQLLPGAVCLVARKGKIVYHKAFGYRNLASRIPMEKDDIFRIMSMTKAITSVAVMMLFEEGQFLLHEPISKFIPEFKNPKVLKRLILNSKDTSFTAVAAKQEITIWHLLTHTAGIPYNHPLQHKAGIPPFHTTKPLTLSQTIPKLAQLPLMHEPGEQFTYGLSTDVLGYLIEKVSGMTLSEFFTKRIFKPLGMHDTFFYVPSDKKERLVMLCEEVEGKVIPHTNAAEYADYATEGAQTYYSGGAGLCSTAADYANFMQMLLNGGRYNGVQLLSRKTIEMMTQNQIGELTTWRGTKFGLGFELLEREQISRVPGSVGVFRWDGMYSTFFWIDPKEELIAVFMSQVWPTSQTDLAQRVQTLVYQAIVD
ncbi:MAG: serine hydrolase [Cytophagales bacterium]|nr:beta-lactamase family protein [Bernardetiaceae bacterium]MDW8211240.1 serine hydrolase [Cytophagales bacterium]